MSVEYISASDEVRHYFDAVRLLHDDLLVCVCVMSLAAIGP